jgi:hypothetical protein
VRKILISCLLALLLLSGSGSGWAAYHYIRPGATGNNNGNDWVNAYPSIPTLLIRGDTYYLADGTYPETRFTTPVSGSLSITIKKAIPADHGIDNGWIDTYGTGVASFEGTTTGAMVYITTSNWIIDGQTGSEETGHGIKITTTACGISSKLLQVAAGASNITITHVEMEHCGEDIGQYDVTLSQDAFYLNGDGTNDNITISNCNIHNASRMLILIAGASNCTIERNAIHHNHNVGVGRPHMQGIQFGSLYTPRSLVHDVTVRYNVFHEIMGTGVIQALNNDFYNFDIYGNLIYTDNSDRYSTSPRTIGSTSNDNTSVHSMHVYNNTIVNQNIGTSNQCGVSWANIYGEGVDNTSIVYNNLFYNNANFTIGSGQLRGFNWYYNSNPPTGTQSEPNIEIGTPDVFENLSAKIFTLKKSTKTGIPLPSPFNEDMFGKIRGGYGVWQRGAYELITKRPLSPFAIAITP